MLLNFKEIKKHLKKRPFKIVFKVSIKNSLCVWLSKVKNFLKSKIRAYIRNKLFLVHKIDILLVYSFNSIT